MSATRFIICCLLVTGVAALNKLNNPTTIDQACPVPILQLPCNPEAESISNKVCELPKQYCYQYEAEEYRHFDKCESCSVEPCTGTLTEVESERCHIVCPLFMHQECLNNLQEKYDLVPRVPPESRAGTATETVTDPDDLLGCTTRHDGWMIAFIVILGLVVAAAVIVCILYRIGKLVIRWVPSRPAPQTGPETDPDRRRGADRVDTRVEHGDQQMTDLVHSELANQNQMPVDVPGSESMGNGLAISQVPTVVTENGQGPPVSTNNSQMPLPTSNGNSGSNGLENKVNKPMRVGTDKVTMVNDGISSNNDREQVTNLNELKDGRKPLNPSNIGTTQTIPKSRRTPELLQNEESNGEGEANSEHVPLLDRSSNSDSPLALSLTEDPKSNNPVQAENQGARSEYAIKK